MAVYTATGLQGRVLVQGTLATVLGWLHRELLALRGEQVRVWHAGADVTQRALFLLRAVRG